MRPVINRWLKLLLGLGLFVGFILFAHHLSPKLGGASGAMFESVQKKDINAAALFYSDYGDIGEFLNDGKGRYASGVVSVHRKDTP